MSRLDHVEMRFSGGDEAPELDDYRPISPLVVVACIAGMASLLAVVHPLLWIIPAVAVILSVCAIWQVSVPRSRYGGRAAAVAALCLAGLIGTYAPARSISLERELYKRAQANAEEWISLVQQGRYEEAHQFTLTPVERFQGPGRLTDLYHPPEPSQPNTTLPEPSPMDDSPVDPADMIAEMSASDRLTAYLRDPIITKIIALGEQASIAHIQNVSIGAVYDNFEVTQRFRVSGVRDGQPGSIEFLVTSTRWKALGHANWQFSELKEVE